MSDAFPATALAPDGFPKSGWNPPDTGVQLAPGGEADARARGLMPPAAPQPAPTVTAVPVLAPPARAVQVVDLSGKPTSGVYDLQWPKMIDGVEHRQVFLRRLSTGEVSDLVARVRAAPDGSKDQRFPMFYDAAGALLTDEVWDAYDADDTDALVEKADAFLPARFQAARPAPDTSPPAA